MNQPVQRGLFYLRDSSGQHEMTPGEYVKWAQRRAHDLDVTFEGTSEEIDAMIGDGRSISGDLYLDYGVSGNILSRKGLDGLLMEAVANSQITHVFIPRRDRLARPDNPLEGVHLEEIFRSSGVTLVFMDRVCPARPKGKRADVAELIMAVLDYDRSGQDRRDLAQKILLAHLRLAKEGFSTGGRPPYGFRRWLVKSDGTMVRELQPGERVRMAGHHVVWLPTAEEELKIIRRILKMLTTMPASRVAEKLNKEGVPSPDTGRYRTDNGVKHQVSGLWHTPTIVGIARNPLLTAVCTYGTRSMGDQLRFTPEGPRELELHDYRTDEKPKVIRNQASDRITAPARFDSLVDPHDHQQLLAELDKRAGTQRGKPRSKDPTKNPLGSRIFDINCTWPMYRAPYQGSFRYTCGFYLQSSGAECTHNHVSGPTATQFVLSCIRQRLLSPTLLPKLKERLNALAQRECQQDSHTKQIQTKTAELAKVQQDLQRASRNMALAESPEQYQAVAAVFDELKQQESSLQSDLAKIQSIPVNADVESEVSAALEFAEDLVARLGEGEDFEVARQIFEATNAKLFLSFRPTKVKKRVLNKLQGGIVTFGAAPPPIEVYTGVTDRKRLKEANLPNSPNQNQKDTSEHISSGGKDNSLRNVSRGDKTPLELFIAGAQRWNSTRNLAAMAFAGRLGP